MGTSPEGLSRFCYWYGLSHNIIVGSNISLSGAKKNIFLPFHFWQRRVYVNNGKRTHCCRRSCENNTSPCT